MFQSIDPATDEVVATYEVLSEGALEARLERAVHAQRAWRKTSFEDRRVILNAVAAALRAGRASHAQTITQEMGKVLPEALAEVDKCAWVCEHYAEGAAAMLAERPVDAGMTESVVVHRPLGLVLAVMPWNFPYWQVLRFAAPYLMAGNGVLLKHAPRTMGCALAIERACVQAGLPEGLLSALLVEERTVGRLIADPRIAAVSMTGSEKGGRAIGAMAGQHLKRAVLELGGSDPYLVLEDADLEAAAKACVAGRMLNAGQSCIAAKRFLVVEDVQADFTEAVIAEMKARVMGPPMKEGVHLGPLARHDLRHTLHEQVQRSVHGGARLALGGVLPQGDGSFYEPTVLVDVPTAGVPASDEELFGPVAAIASVKDEAEAIEVANRSRYGLGAAVFTQDLARGRRIAIEALEAGACFVNEFVKSDPRLPFGGVKASGYGRELGEAGIKELVNVKTVCIK